MSGMGGPGYGATGGGLRDEAGLNAGTSGSQAFGDRGTGAGEVHTELSVGGTTSGGGYEAIAPANQGTTGEGGLRENAVNRVREVAGQVRDRAQNLLQDAPDRLSGVTGQARERVGQAMDRAESLLEERGVLSTIRDNPLPALGIAFGLGFLLAGSDDDDGASKKRPGAMYKAKHQLKGAIMGGLSAAVAQEARNLLGMAQGQGNQGGLLGSLMDNLQGGGSSGGQGGSSRSGGSSGGAGGTSTSRPPSHQELG